jgi:1-acyl-sn-glycerol-3-phosphate acyltransferase
MVVDRATLLEQAIAFLGDHGADEERRVRERIGRLLAGTEDAEIARFVHRLLTTGASWGYHPPDPLARRINHAMAELLLEPGSELDAASRLAPAAGEPIVLVANHLSFADANLLEALLHAGGHEAVAARLTVLVGPKVFSEPYRRLSSLCFGAIKLAQSPSRASGDALMPRREVARVAAETLGAVAERRAAGDHLLVFVEGTRSRDARMQRALPAVSRYLDGADALVFPVGIHGSERLVPVGEERVHRTRAGARIGPALRAGRLRTLAGGKRGLVADALGVAIAALLPAEYRGAYSDDAAELDAARAIATAAVAE